MRSLISILFCLLMLLLPVGAQADQPADGYLQSISPADGALIDVETVWLKGDVASDVNALRVDGRLLEIDDGRFSAGPFKVAPGARSFLFAAEKADGGSTSWVHRIEVDRAAPSIAVQAPTAALFRSSPVMVDALISDPNLETVTVGGRTVSSVIGGRIRVEVSLQEGPQTVTIVARDRLGHERRQDLSMVLDTRAPSLELLADGRALTDGDVFAGTVQVEARSNDGNVRFFLNGRLYGHGTTHTQDIATSQAIPLSDEGPFEIEAVATDAAGNETRESARLVIDRTPPHFTSLDQASLNQAAPTHTAADSYVVQGEVRGASSVTVNGRPVTLSNGIFRSAPLPLKSGRQSFRVVATDAAGNESSTTLAVKSDPDAPVLSITSPSSGTVFGSGPISVSGTASDLDLAGVTVNGSAATLSGSSWSLDGITLVEGSQSLTAVATDAVGNSSTEVVSVVLDSTAPTLSILAGGAPLVDGAVFAGLVTPEVSAGDATEITMEATLDGMPWSSGTTVDSLGSHNLSVTATDAGGNSASMLVTFTVEGTPPVFGTMAPAHGSVTGQSSLTLQGRVEGAIALQIDGAPVTLQGSDFVAGPYSLTEGSRSWTLLATSAGGQTEEITHTLILDTTAPGISMTPPSQGVVSEASLTVSGTVQDAHFAQLSVNGRQVTVSGDPALAPGATWSTSVSLVDGDNTVRAVATDRAGQSATVDIQVELDHRAPVLEVIEPSQGTVVSGATVELFGRAIDANLDRVEVDGVAATLDGESWSSLVTLASGPSTISITAFDTLSQSSTTSLEITRDDTLPELVIQTPAVGTVTSASTVDVSGTVSFPDAGTAATLTVNGVEADVVSGSVTSGTPDTWSVTGIELHEGENTLVARATSTAGGQSVRTREILRDVGGPELVSANPVDGSPGIALDRAFTLTFSEAMAEPSVGAWRLETAAGQAIAAVGEWIVGAGEPKTQLRITPSALLPAASEIRLVLTAGLEDLAGFAITPSTLSYSTVSAGGPAAPTLSTGVPSRLCAASLDLQGTAGAGLTVRVDGGAGSAETRADDAGQFQIHIALLNDRLHRLELRAVDVDGRESSAAVLEVTRDCRAPSVLSSALIGDVLTVSYDEALDPSTVQLSLSDASGPLAGTLSTEGATLTWTASGPLPSALLSLEIAAGVADSAGNATETSFVRLFGAEGASTFVAGTVVDQATGRPLVGALVRVSATDGAPSVEPVPEQTTSDDGRFLIPVPAGTHDLTISRPSYSPVFRTATTDEGEGTDVFTPRLQPTVQGVEIGSAGGQAAGGTAAGGTAGPGAATLDLPSATLAGQSTVRVTALPEQALSALLPYGWSPRGAAWIDLGAAPSQPTNPALPLTLSLATESPSGTLLTAVYLDLESLQWRALADVSAGGGRVEVELDASLFVASAGLASVAVVEADTGALAPPVAVAGEVLGSSATPTSAEVTAATLTFDPELVLPTQTSEVTVSYSLATPQPSGLPLWIAVQEELELLDGTVRREAPYSSHLVLYRDATGAARSQFQLRPSDAAQTHPIRVGAEVVSVLTYDDETVRGNVLGPDGGSVIGASGDVLEVPSGALAEPTAITLTRATVGDLPTAAPGGGTVDAIIELELGGQTLTGPGLLTVPTDPAPPADARGLLLHVVQVDGAPAYRAVAELEPTAAGWSTVAIGDPDADPNALPWTGVREGGIYLALRLDFIPSFVRGRAADVNGLPLSDAVISSAAVDWIQLTDALGRYVLPVPEGEVQIDLHDPVTGNGSSYTVTVGAGTTLDLDPQTRVVAPRVISTNPVDGAEVPAGINPRINFSEAIDPSSAAEGIRLRRGGEDVDFELEVQGALITVLPRASLIPGVPYELLVFGGSFAGGIRDLEGFGLEAPTEVTFTISEVALPNTIDLSKVLLYAPDSAGQARIVGEAGSVPANHLVWVENLTSYHSTESVTSTQSGAFELTVGADLNDTILFHILIEGGNEITKVLGPFLRDDRLAAWVGGDEELSFVTADSFEVTVPAGMFDQKTWLELKPKALDEAVPSAEGLIHRNHLIELDFDGAEARKSLRLKVPNADPEAVYMINRQIQHEGSPKWMLHDLAWKQGDSLTNEDADELLGPPPGNLTGGPIGDPSGDPENLRVLEPIQAGQSVKSAVTGAQKNTARPPYRYKRYLPEMVYPGIYEIAQPTDLVAFVILPTPAGVFVNLAVLGLDAIVTRINAATAQLLEYDAVMVPALLERPLEIEIRQLSTGYLMYSGVFAPPVAGELTILPPSTWGDETSPTPIQGGPLRFFTITPRAGLGSGELDPGMHWDFDEDTQQLTVEAVAGTLLQDTEVVLLSVDDDSGSQTKTIPASGAFQIQTTAELEQRYVLGIGALVSPRAIFDISFSEGLDLDFPGILVWDEQHRAVDITPSPVGTTETVRIRPRTQWRAGERYELELAPDLKDAVGNEWNRSLRIPFKIEQGQVLDTFAINAVRDVKRLGSWLLVAAGHDGLMVLDASDPADLKNVLPGNSGFKFPLGDQVMGLDIDPHGRVVIVGGGITSFGQLKIFDPLAMDVAAIHADPDNLALRNAAFKGSTIISDQLGAIGTQLPAGTPRRVSVLSNDDIDLWFAGQVPPEESTITMEPSDFGRYDLVITGETGYHLDVVLQNLENQGVQSMNSGAVGDFDLSLNVRTGDLMELRIDGQIVTRWRAGRQPGPGVFTDPAAVPADAPITLRGEGEPGQPVTVRNHTTGSWHRVDTATDGTFEITVEVSPGDRLEVLRNRDSVAYVATLGVGLEAVDVNTVYHKPEVWSPYRGNLLGMLTGFGYNPDESDLDLCGIPNGDFSTALTEIDTFFDPGNPYPLSIAGLVSLRGLAMVASVPSSPGQMGVVGAACGEYEESSSVSGLAVVQRYPFDLNGDGEIQPEYDEVRDYVVMTHRGGALLIFDVTDRSYPEHVGSIPLPAAAAHVEIDRARRQLYVSAYGSGIFVVDFNNLPDFEMLDQDGDGRDDRVLEELLIGGNTNTPLIPIPELGLGIAGGLDRGVTTIAVGSPTLVALADDATVAESGVARQVERLAPYGVPSDIYGSRPGSFRLQAKLPGVVGDEVTMKLTSLGPGGAKIDPAGDPAIYPDLPPVELESVVLRRQATEPWQDGYQLYVSDEIVVLADLRASQHVEPTDEERAMCHRCGPDGISSGALEILSGDRIAVQFADPAADGLEAVYTPSRLAAAEIELESVRWEPSPSIRQEPTIHPSKGRGDVAPGTLLHSGEMVVNDLDLFIRGRGLDFAFGRSYRNQTLGGGPLGPGWDMTYRRRLRELPNGDVELFDGTGRRETLQHLGDGTYAPPPGRFVSLQRNSTGFLMVDEKHGTARFDRWGRLVSVADPSRTAPDKGNEIAFHYDARSRLVSMTDTLGREIAFTYKTNGLLETLTDFTGREVTYGYDAQGRLETVTSPEVTTGLAQYAEGLVTTYAYSPIVGDLMKRLVEGNNLTSITDARGVNWLTLEYHDGDNDLRHDEVKTQTWGGDTVQLAFDFTLRQTVVTDRRSYSRTYEHNESGQLTKFTDPLGHVTDLQHDAEQRLIELESPLGGIENFSYGTSGGSRRAFGQVLSVEQTPDSRGTNSYGAGSCSAEQEEECREDYALCSCSFISETGVSYDPRTHQPLSVANRRGDVTTFERAESGLPNRVVLGDGSFTDYEYNDFGQVVKETNGLDHVKEYVYFTDGPAEGYLEKVTTGGLLTTTYEVDELGRITAEIDGRGGRTEMVWNEVDWLVETRRATASIDADAPALGFVNRMKLDEIGQVIEEQIPFGDAGEAFTTVKTVFGDLGEVLSVEREVSPGGALINNSFEYDANRNLTRAVNPRGYADTFDYDERNLRIAAHLGDNAITETWQYDAEHTLLQYVDGRGKIWTYEHDGRGRLKKEIDPLGNYSTYAYDADSNLAAARSFNAVNQLLASTVVTYDAVDRPIEVTHHLLDANGLLVDTITAQSIFDHAGNLIRTHDAHGRPTHFEYDDAGRLIAAIDAVGNRTDLLLDGNGNALSTIITQVLPDATTSLVTQTAGYDALNRPVWSRDSLGNTTRTAYDSRSNPIRTTDAEQHDTVQTFDALDRVLTRIEPESIAQYYTYDNNSNLTRYADALGNATVYTYDALDLNRSVTYADDTVETFVYDSGFNLTQHTDANGTVIAHTYDHAGRLLSRSATLAAGIEGVTTETFAYDGLGRAVRGQSGSVITELSFDSLSRTISETTLGRTVGYSYNKTGAMIGWTYPSGLNLEAQLDLMDRPLEIGPAGVPQPSARYSWRGLGSLQEKALSNGLLETRTFDAAERPLSVRAVNSSAEVVLEEILSWSPRYLKTAEVRNDFAANSRAYAYDAARRVVATGQSSAEVLNNTTPSYEDVSELPDGYGFDYDAAQNLLSRTQRKGGAESTVDLPTDGSGRNRPGSVDGKPLAWDANGNLIQKDDWRFAYDFRNRMVRVWKDGQAGDIAQYEYDINGRRVRKTVGTDVVETAWSGWMSLEEYTNGVLSARRTFGLGMDDVILTELDLGGTWKQQVPLFDSSGNVTAVTDESGSVIERYTYSPFGERSVWVDSMGPAVEQVRSVGDSLWLEMTEELVPQPLEDAAQSGWITLVDDQSNSLPVQVTQPVLTGREARRRLAITTTDPPTAGTSVTLTVSTEALRDVFGNPASTTYSLTFPWPAADTVLEDTEAPVLQEAVVEGGRLVLRFDEAVDPASNALQVDGATVTWNPSADGYSLTSAAILAAGDHTLALTAQPLDLDGQAPAPQSFDFNYVGNDDGWIFEAVDPNRIAGSAAGNLYGFHGRPIDAETGLMYFRNRYYDPEMGRFLSTDPYGYVDGPSSYQYGLNSPSNISDPTGEFGLIGGALSVAFGGAIAWITDTPYSMEDAAIDFAAGAIGAGVASKLGRIGGLVGGFVLRNVIDAEISTIADIAKHELKGEEYDAGKIFKTNLAFSALGDLAGPLSRKVFGGFDPPTSLSRPKAEFNHTQIYGGGNHVEADSAAIANQWRRNTEVSTTCKVSYTCFAAGTMVATLSGPVAIEAIEVGDWVWARSELTDQAELAEVVNLFERQVAEIWVLSAGETVLETTDEHPFFVEGQGWTQAEDLKSGDWLATLDGALLRLDTVERVERQTTVFNFEVRGLHNYFVGDDQVLVHNCDEADIAADDFVTLWKAPGRGRRGVAQEVVEGYDPARYPGMGPFFGTKPDVAAQFSFKYENGIQEIRIPRGLYDGLVSDGIIRLDPQLDDAVHVPAGGLDRFNEALRQGPPNSYKPPKSW